MGINEVSRQGNFTASNESDTPKSTKKIFEKSTIHNRGRILWINTLKKACRCYNLFKDKRNANFVKERQAHGDRTTQIKNEEQNAPCLLLTNVLRQDKYVESLSHK